MSSTIPRTGLTAVAIFARAISIVAAAVGIAFTVLAVIGPSVWVFADDGSGAGSFVSLPLLLRIAHALAVLIPCLTATAVALLLAELTTHARDVRFSRALTRSTIGLAVTLGVGSWLAQVAANVARWSYVVVPDGGDAADGHIEWVSVIQTIWPDWPMLGIAVAIGILAVIIRTGERLQRETEGLV